LALAGELKDLSVHTQPGLDVLEREPG